MNFSRLHIFISISFLLLLVVSSSSSYAQEENQLIPTSAPDIYPDENDVTPWIGMIEVTFVPNAPNCDIYYQLNTSLTGTTREPDDADKELTRDPFLDNPAKSKSILWNGRYPLQITAVGRTKVTAFCVPVTAHDAHGPSKPTIHYYNIAPSDIDHPIADPPPGKYVSSPNLVIRLREPDSVGMDPVHRANDARCDIMYSIDDPSPGEQWVTLSPGGGIEIGDYIGHHVIYAKCVLRTQADANHKNNGKSSAVVRLNYDITPPLMFDVGTECEKCNRQPTHGYFFTVVLQGAERGDKFFLTTSSNGCNSRSHFLDHSQEKILAKSQRAFKFSATEGDVRVWVCLKKHNSNDGKYHVVPIRKAGSNHRGSYIGSSQNNNQQQSSASNTAKTRKDEEQFFYIEKAIDDVPSNYHPPQEITHAPGSQYVDENGNNNGNNNNKNAMTSNPNSGLGFVGTTMLIAVVVFALFFVVRIVRIMLKTDGNLMNSNRKSRRAQNNE